MIRTLLNHANRLRAQELELRALGQGIAADLLAAAITQLMNTLKELPRDATTNTQLQLVPDTFEFAGFHFPIAFSGEDGVPWFKATEAANIIGWDVDDGRNATRMVDDNSKGRHSVTTLGGQQEVVCVDLFGLIQMLAHRRGTLGTRVRDALVGFTQAAVARLAGTAAPSLNVSEMRAKAALLNAEARVMREQRLSRPTAPRTLPPVVYAEDVTDTVIACITAMGGPDGWVRRRDLGRKLRRVSTEQLDVVLRALTAAKRIETRTEQNPHHTGGNLSTFLRVRP